MESEYQRREEGEIEKRKRMRRVDSGDQKGHREEKRNGSWVRSYSWEVARQTF